MAWKKAGVASDTVDLDDVANEIYVEVSGYVKMTLWSGGTIEVFLNPGKHQFQVRRLWLTTDLGAPATGVTPFV